MIKKQKLAVKILVGILGVSLLLMPFTGCVTEEEEPTISFADVDWDSVQVHNRIAAFILEHGYGYQSQFIPGKTIPLFEGVARGDIDVEMECWIKYQQEAYDKHIAAGDVIDLGSNFPDSREGWLVPTYIIEGDADRGIEPMAPDLKSVDDLPRYWELFKDPEDPSKGRFYSSPPGNEAEIINEGKFDAYGLNEYYNIMLPGSNMAVVGSMVAAYEKGEPWLGYYWEPTWVLGRLDMTYVEEPPYDKEVWETNYGCSWPSGPVNIVVHKSFPDRFPEVVEFLENYETTLEQNNAFLAYLDENEASTKETAIWFLQEYESVWTKWVPSDIASKVKAALP